MKLRFAFKACLALPPGKPAWRLEQSRVPDCARLGMRCLLKRSGQELVNLQYRGKFSATEILSSTLFTITNILIAIKKYFNSFYATRIQFLTLPYGHAIATYLEG